MAQFRFVTKVRSMRSHELVNPVGGHGQYNASRRKHQRYLYMRYIARRVARLDLSDSRLCMIQAFGKRDSSRLGGRTLRRWELDTGSPTFTPVPPDMFAAQCPVYPVDRQRAGYVPI